MFFVRIPEFEPQGLAGTHNPTDPGAIAFTSGFSREHKYSTVGEQITVEQLIELCIIMRISRHDHVYRHHVRDK